MKLFFTFFVIVITCSRLSAQTVSVKGIVQNEDAKPLANASVFLFHEGSKDTLKTVTNDKGLFTFKDVPAMKTGIAVTFLDYNALARFYDYSNASGEQVIADLKMVPGGKTLDDVTVQASMVQIKEDTVSFRIDSTMYRKNDNVEELLKKLPGVEVDSKTGAVTTQGQQVTKVRVNGKDFFGGDVTTATKNINADLVERIDVIDDYGDQSAFTGVKTGDATKTLNIQLKKDKNKGYFGNAALGAGTDERFTNSLTVNKFNNEQQISLIGNLNNTNTSSFNFGNMGGVMGGMARSIGGAFGNFGGNAGIANTKSIGLNYRDQFGKKISFYGSYSFTNKGTNTLQDINQENIFANNSIVNRQSTRNFTETNNHRASFNLEYKIDKFNYLKFTPTVNYQTSRSNFVSDFFFNGKDGQLLNSGRTTDFTNSISPNLSGILLFNHRFDAKGRILSLNASAGKSATDGDDTYTNTAQYFDLAGNVKDSVLRQFITQDNNNHNYGISASYIEPFNKKQSLEFNYAYNKQFTGIDRENFFINDAGQKNFIDTASTIYDNEYITNRFGVNFRNNQKKFNYTLGLAVQPATISSSPQTNGVAFKQNITNFFPVVRFAYNFSRSRSLNVNYNGRSNQPSYTQLQPVADYSNPQYVVVGNPNLRPEFTNTLSLRYNNFNFIKGDVFFGNINFNYTQDKIANNVFNKGIGVQETRYLNTDGFYTVSGFYAFSKPFKNRKYVFNYGGNVLYNNNVSFIENVKNVGQNYVLSQRFNTVVTIKKWLETGAGVNYTLNQARYTLRPQLNSTTKAWALTQNSRLFLKKDFTINYDLSKTINQGFGGSVATNPFIINSSIEKLVSKKYNASLRLNAFDMLNQNTNINRVVTGNSITDSRTNNLGRYYMLSFVFRFSKFVGRAPSTGMGLGGPPPPPPGL